MAGTVNVDQMRQNYANVLAQQQQKALRGVQDIYAQRGTTGSGEEAVGMGELGNQFGAAAGAYENQLQQYLGGLGMQQAQMQQQESQFGRSLGEQQAGRQQQGAQFGQSLAEQIAGRQQQGQQFGQQFGESQRQFNVGQENWGKQFGLQQGAQQFGQQATLADLYSRGVLGADARGQFQGTPFGNVQSAQQIAMHDPLNQLAQQYGLGSAEYMNLVASVDPSALKSILQGGQTWGYGTGGTPQNQAANQQAQSQDQLRLQQLMMSQRPGLGLGGTLW